MCEYVKLTSIGPSSAGGRSSIGDASKNRDIFKVVRNSAVPSIVVSTGVNVTTKSAANVKSGSNSAPNTLNENGIADWRGNINVVTASSPNSHASLSIANPGIRIS